MSIRPNLLAFGSALVGFPLLCLIVFIAILFLTLGDLESKLDSEEQSTEIIFQTQKLMTETSEEFFELGVGFGVVEGSVPTFRKRVKALSARYDAYIKYLAGIPRHEQDARKLAEYWTEFSREVNPEAPGKEPYFKTIVGSRMAKKGFRVINLLDDIANSEEVSGERDIRETTRVLSALVDRVYAGLGASVAIAFLIWFFYAVSIKRPLLKLIEDGIALGDGVPLSPRMKGWTNAAELVELDMVLHEVSDAVEQSLSDELDTINFALDLICTLEEDGTIKSVNPYIEKLTGFSVEEVTGRSILEYVAEDQVSRLKLLLGEAITSGIARTFEIDMRSRNQSLIETRWSCLHSPDNNSFFVIVHDITEERQVERLKRDFSDMVSTDLRTPLAELKVSLDRIVRTGDVELTEKLAKGFSKTSDNLERLIMLADELLDFQKLQGTGLELDWRENDLVPVIEDAIGYVERLAEARGIVLEMTSDVKPVFSFDRIRILQTMVNLISNAVKFTPDNGRIEVRILPHASDEKESVEILVMDSGTGVPESHHEKIFQAFEQVSSRDAKIGTGLGLAICKLFIDAHDGRIAVMRPGEIADRALSFSDGSSCKSIFRIELPCGARNEGRSRSGTDQ